MLVEVDQQGAIGMAFAPREVIHPERPRCSNRGIRCPTDQAEERRGTGGHPQTVSQTTAAFTTEGEAKQAHEVAEPVGAAGVRSNHGWQALRENAPRALRHGAKELPDLEIEPHGNAAPGQIGQGARVAAMDA